MDKETKDKFFWELMEENYEKVYVFLRKGNIDKAFAEDVVQETFLEAYRKAELLAEHPNRLGWLYTAAKLKMIKMLSKRENAWSLDDENITIDKEYSLGKLKPFKEWDFDEIELAETIKTSVSEEEYEMIRDYYLNGYTAVEVADKYGLDKGGFRMRMSRLKKKLKDDIIAGWPCFLIGLWLLR